MAKPDKANQASSKPNKGQDENLHTFVAPDGSQVEQTQRWFRTEGKAAGYTALDDDADDGAEAPGDAPVEPPA